MTLTMHIVEKTVIQELVSGLQESLNNMNVESVQALSVTDLIEEIFQFHPEPQVRNWLVRELGRINRD